ncbi:MAG: DUF1552 domain-containing protein, partial [Anaerolineaceae bacterium]
ARLSPEDKIRLDHHLTAVQEAEKQLLASGAELGGNCQLPSAPTVDPYALGAFPAVGKIQMDLLHMALACDLTRVASLQWARAGNPIVHSWADPAIKEGHHSLSHQPMADTTSIGKLVAINQWFAKQLAYLCGKLVATPEGDGNMLDNTVIVWGNEISVGQTHSRQRIPFVLAGKCGGYFPGGRFLAFQGAPHNQLLVSLCNAMDVPATTFGNPAYEAGELPGLKA